jgi:flagellin
MGFRINTNIAALNAHNSATINNRSLDKSLGALSSGLRINSAADDSSGLVIADSLRSQANGLGQAIRNANDAIGIIQTADKAMDEQIKILDTIKTKAIQSASDGQSASSREAIQQDVNRLISSLNNIAQTTAFNGQSLLSGKYENKEFQVGAYSNQTVQASIGNTESVAIGNIQQTTDTTTLGNIVPTTAIAVTGATTISVAVADLNGLAKGDIISFEGSTNTYSVQNVAVSTGTIELSVPLTEDIALGSKISVSSYANNPSGYLQTTTADIVSAATFVIDPTSDQMKGLAIGDTLTFINSVGASTTETITAIEYSTGTVSIAGLVSLTVGLAATLKIFVDTPATMAASTTVSVAALAQTSTVISTGVLDATGLGKGDVIRISNGVDTQDFVIEGVNSSSGEIALNNAIATAFSVGSTITLMSSAQDNSHYATGAMADQATTITVTDTTLDVRGLAAGDVVTLLADDGTTVDATISSIATSSGVITFDGPVTITGGITAGKGGILEVKTSDVLGNSLTSADYVQYTVEGTKIDGVQITDGNGYGTAGTGLGRVAEQINIMSDVTGVTAVADVSKTGTGQITATTLAADMTINGVTVLAAGTSLLAGDSDNKLIDSINAKSSETGVSATLVDGKLKLSSDGRAMALSGFTSTAKISDGLHSGSLTFTKNGSDPISITAGHYSDANLATENTNGATKISANATAFNLSDLVNGRVDDNGDGTVDASDTIGLLRTREGANVAIDIVGKAISELDATRSGLGSAQNELLVTVNNISVTQVNVKAAESQIRDVDFAAESANFSRLNILAQSGSYAMSQANAIQQNVLRLLQ